MSAKAGIKRMTGSGPHANGRFDTNKRFYVGHEADHADATDTKPKGAPVCPDFCEAPSDQSAIDLAYKPPISFDLEW
jgi:hypothetical protein